MGEAKIYKENMTETELTGVEMMEYFKKN